MDDGTARQELEPHLEHLLVAGFDLGVDEVIVLGNVSYFTGLIELKALLPVLFVDVEVKEVQKLLFGRCVLGDRRAILLCDD